MEEEEDDEEEEEEKEEEEEEEEEEDEEEEEEEEGGGGRREGRGRSRGGRVGRRSKRGKGTPAATSLSRSSHNNGQRNQPNCSSRGQRKGTVRQMSHGPVHGAMFRGISHKSRFVLFLGISHISKFVMYHPLCKYYV